MKVGSTTRLLLCALTCAALAACSSKAERIQTSLHKATEYLRLSEWDKAGVEARNVLQMDPKSADGYLIAAQVEDGKAAFRNAYGNYMKVLELRPGSLEAQVGVARIYLLSGELDRAAKSIDLVLSTDPSNLRAKALHAVLAARQEHRDAALDEARRIVAGGQPLPMDSRLALAGLFYNLKDTAAALALLDQAIAADPRDARPVEMAAEIVSTNLSDDNAATRAVGYYRAATVLGPRNTGLWNSWALLHMRRKETDLAENVLRASIKAVPEDDAREQALVEFLAAQRIVDVAEKEIDAAIEARPKDAQLRFVKADLYRGAQRTDDAIRALEGIVALGRDLPAGLTARGQLAALWLEAGKTAEARQTLADLLKANPRDATGLLLRARMRLNEGNARDAIVDLRSAFRDKPGSAELAGLLAQAHHMAAEPQLAREALTDAVKFNGKDAQLHMLLAADMATAREFKAADAEVDEAIRLAPGNWHGYEMKVYVALGQGDLAGAGKTVAAMEERFPKLSPGHILHGRVLANQRNIDGALRQYDEALALAPKTVEPIVAAVGLLVGERRFKEAQERIDSLLARNPASAVAMQMRGELALARGDLAQADQAFQACTELANAPPSAYKNLAAVKVARHDLDGALAVVDRGEKAHPSDGTLALARAEWLGRAGRTGEAIATYDALLKRQPDNEPAANNLAFLLAEQKGDKPSLERALQLANRFALSPVPAYMDTLGLVRFRLGMYDQAAIVLERAVSLAPAEPLLQLHYGMALVKKGELQRGRDVLRKAIDSKRPMPGLDEARTLLAQG